MPSQLARALELFEAVVDLPPADRAFQLAQHTAGNPELLASVERLLAADAASGEFLESPPALDHTLLNYQPTAGDQLGSWQLLRPLGEGGMGVVWLAERTGDGFTQSAAVKFTRSALFHPDALARLRRERRILAMLDHPHIARLLDGGTAPPATLWLAMEFVDGPNILRYAADHALSLRARLRLFLPLCDAVDYAHQRLVVHRDIKPANILVTAPGQVKLTDFGIAKLLNSESPEQTAMLCTPSYASPEQWSDSGITTRTDVYGLGLVLYELLTGRPARAPQATPLDPIPPASLDPDLYTILATCLQSDPLRRYRTAGALAEDLERYLASQPIHARPDSLLYRARKFVERNRALTLVASLAAIALLLGALLFWRQSRDTALARTRAEQRLAQLRRLSTTALFDYQAALAQLPGTTALRERMIRDSLAYLDGIQQDADYSSDPGLLEDIASARIRLGDILGRPWSANRGDPRSALQNYEFAASLAVRLPQGAKHPLYLEALTRQGEILNRLQDWPRAEAVFRQAEQGSADLPHLRSNILGSLAVVLHRTRPLEAVALAQQALGLTNNLIASRPQDPTLLNRAAVLRQRLGNWLRSLGRLPEALEHHLESTRLMEQVTQLRPNEREPLRNFADQLVMKAETHAQAGDSAVALRDADRGIGILKSFALADPGNEESLRDLGYAYYARAAAAGHARLPQACDLASLNQGLFYFEQLANRPLALKEDVEAWEGLLSRRKTCLASVRR